MNKHTQEAMGSSSRGRPNLRVLEGKHRVAETSTLLEERDVSALVGVRTIACNAAIERRDAAGQTIELPKLRELIASALVTRCLMPIRLRGHEIRAMRKGMRMTLNELAKKLGGKTAPETVSRWEAEGQPIGSHAERVLRLIVCEQLKKEAPGIEYDAEKLASMNEVDDPWATDPDYEVPPVVLIYMPMKVDHSVIDAWNEKKNAA
jgi:DNA-binding transcriptional regulator YiaG